MQAMKNIKEIIDIRVFYESIIVKIGSLLLIGVVHLPLLQKGNIIACMNSCRWGLD
jgi:hypothetical protein